MPNEKTVWDALAAAMADMDNPVKSKAVQAGARRYNYEVLADVLDIVKPALFAHGLCLKQGVSMEEGATVMRTGVGYGEQVYILDTLPVTIPADPQAAGSAITYARRYGLKTAFGLAGVDDDGEAAKRAVEMPLRGSESRSKAPSAPAAGASPLSEKERFVALLGQCRQQGLDSVAIGKQVGAMMGKASKDFTEADYTQACRLVIDIAAKMKEAGHASA